MFNDFQHIFSISYLDVKKCICQGYDGAATLTGHLTGGAVEVKKWPNIPIIIIAPAMRPIFLVRRQ